MRTLEQLKIEISLNRRLDLMTADEKLEWIYTRLKEDFENNDYNADEEYQRGYDEGYETGCEDTASNIDD